MKVDMLVVKEEVELIVVFFLSLVVSGKGKCGVLYFMVLFVVVNDVFVDVVFIVKVDDIWFVFVVLGKIVVMLYVMLCVLVVIMFF